MEKILKISLAEYNELLDDKGKLKAEIQRLNELLKKEGRVVDLKILQTGRIDVGDHWYIKGYEYPVYESIELTDAEERVNEAVKGMRHSMQTFEHLAHEYKKKHDELAVKYSRLDSSYSSLQREIHSLKSRGWFKRLFNIE